MDLSYADLAGATLGSSRIEDCNFTNAHLMDADMSGGRFVNVNWTGANLSGATSDRNLFQRGQLDECRPQRGVSDHHQL